MNKKLHIKDYIALYQLSLRDYFWRIDGRQTASQIRGGTIFNAVYLLTMFVTYGLPLTVIFGAVSMVQSILTLPLVLLNVGGSGMFPVLATLPLTLMGLFLFLVFSPVIFDKNRLSYNLHFLSSAWWQNTGITPSEIKRDKGVYGEYIATMAAEQSLRRNGIYGRILNNVLVPTHGEEFNEIDVLSINETGIHVIEAKAMGGAFEGSFDSETWTQYIGREKHTFYNPIRQNNGHINALAEYLYRKLPAGNLRNKASFPLNFINVVLFCVSGIEDRLNHIGAPSEFFLGMAEGHDGYCKTDLVRTYRKRLTPAEIDAIAEALAEISQYTPEEVSYRVQKRNERRAAEEEAILLGHRPRKAAPTYSMVKVRSRTEDGHTEENYLLCRDNGSFRTFHGAANAFYMALPGAEILQEIFSTKDPAEAEVRYAEFAGIFY